jgi:hypothetical protein
MAFLVKTKSPLFSDVRAGVRFQNGQARITDEVQAALMRELGYEVIELKEEKPPKEAKKAAKKSGD